MALNKKALSEVVAYVLLISISLSLASGVYIWLKNYVPHENALEVECEENVALIISEYNYSCAGQLNLTLKNRGLFDVDGYILRVSNISGATIGVYTLNKTGTNIGVGESKVDIYNEFKTDPVNQEITGQLTLLDLQPIIKRKDKLVYCSNFISKQTLTCE